MDKVTKERQKLRKQLRRNLTVTVHQDLLQSLDGQTVEEAVDFLKTQLLMVPEEHRKSVKLEVNYTSDYYSDRYTQLALKYVTPEPIEDVDKRIDSYLEEMKAQKAKNKERELKDYERLHKKYGRRNNKAPAL
jgi:uncharacterized protein HemY